LNIRGTDVIIQPYVINIIDIFIKQVLLQVRWIKIPGFGIIQALTTRKDRRPVIVSRLRHITKILVKLIVKFTIGRGSYQPVKINIFR